jgi:hypothetical protein
VAKKAKKRAVRKPARKPARKSARKFHVIDLKKLKSRTSIKNELKKASKKKVAIVVLNAPFKLAA